MEEMVCETAAPVRSYKVIPERKQHGAWTGHACMGSVQRYMRGGWAGGVGRMLTLLKEFLETDRPSREVSDDFSCAHGVDMCGASRRRRKQQGAWTWRHARAWVVCKSSEQVHGVKSIQRFDYISSKHRQAVECRLQSKWSAPFGCRWRSSDSSRCSLPITHAIPIMRLAFQLLNSSLGSYDASWFMDHIYYLRLGR